MVTLFWFKNHNKDKMKILVYKKINDLYIWLVSSKYIYRLQNYWKSPITSGSPLVLCLSIDFVPSLMGSAMAWWLMPRTPDPEVGGSSPTRVKPCCVLEQGTFNPQKYW